MAHPVPRDRHHAAGLNPPGLTPSHVEQALPDHRSGSAWALSPLCGKPLVVVPISIAPVGACSQRQALPRTDFAPPRPRGAGVGQEYRQQPVRGRASSWSRSGRGKAEESSSGWVGAVGDAGLEDDTPSTLRDEPML